MSELIAAPVLDAPGATRNGGWWRVGLVTATFLFLWLEVIKHLSAEWSVNPQYSYGWAVPFLALFLLWQRWPTRPAVDPPRTWALPGALILLCAFLFFPIRFVAEANPDWRLLSWTMALAAATMSILLVYLAGGGPWSRHFAFPFVFFLVAVPWPARFEEIVIQDLMRAVTAINVTALNLVGVPALQHGNVIEVSSGMIGIEEACSGVRSLQATLMISLFLGDLYSFTIWRRVLLVFAGAIIAFATNVVRTAALVWIGARRGTSQIEGWHDPAGLTVLLVCLFSLWLVSLMMRRRSNVPPEEVRILHPPATVRNWVFGLILVWLLLVEGGVQFWYGLRPIMTSSRWLVSWPTAEAEYKSVPIAPEAASMLHYNEGGGATWREADGHRWMMYFFRWLPGRTAARFVKVHRPDICLPASGRTIVRDNGIRLVKANDLNLPMRSYLFDDNGTPLHVFYCYWDARSSYDNVAAAVAEDWTPRGRMRAAFRGQRELGAQMLEIVVWGYESDAEAESRMLQQLEQIIRPG